MLAYVNPTSVPVPKIPHLAEADLEALIVFEEEYADMKLLLDNPPPLKQLIAPNLLHQALAFSHFAEVPREEKDLLIAIENLCIPVKDYLKVQRLMQLTLDTRSAPSVLSAVSTHCDAFARIAKVMHVSQVTHVEVFPLLTLRGSFRSLFRQKKWCLSPGASQPAASSAPVSADDDPPPQPSVAEGAPSPAAAAPASVGISQLISAAFELARDIDMTHSISSAMERPRVGASAPDDDNAPVAARTAAHAPCRRAAPNAAQPRAILRPRRLDDAERRRCDVEHLCYHCRKPGHSIANCTEKLSASPSAQQTQTTAPSSRAVTNSFSPPLQSQHAPAQRDHPITRAHQMPYALRSQGPVSSLGHDLPPAYAAPPAVSPATVPVTVAAVASDLMPVDGRVFVKTKMAGREVKALLDSGAVVSCTSREFAHSLGLEPCACDSVRIRVANGNVVAIGECCDIDLTLLQDQPPRHLRVYILSDNEPSDHLILGTDALTGIAFTFHHDGTSTVLPLGVPQVLTDGSAAPEEPGANPKPVLPHESEEVLTPAQRDTVNALLVEFEDVFTGIDEREVA